MSADTKRATAAPPSRSAVAAPAAPLDVADDHAGAFRDEARRDGFADPARRADNDGHATFKPVAHRHSLAASGVTCTVAGRRRRDNAHSRRRGDAAASGAYRGAGRPMQ
jgi:hypothetical protein